MNVLFLLIGIIVGAIMSFALRPDKRSLRLHPSMRYNHRLLNQLDAHTGFAEWDLSNFSVQASAQQAVLFGLEPTHAERRYQDYLRFIHPDYRSQYDQAVQTAIHEEGEFELDFCIVIDEEERWLNSKGQVLLEPGQPPRLIELTQDITMVRSLQKSLLRQEHKWRRLMRNRVEMVVMLDENNRIAYINDTSVSLIGYTSKQLLGASFLDLVHADDHDRVAAALKKLHQRQKSQQSFTYRFNRFNICDSCEEQSTWIWLDAIADDERSTTGGIVLRICKLDARSALYDIPRSTCS